MEDTVSLSLENSALAIICYYHYLFDAQIVPYFACENFFRLASFESFCCVSPFFDQLPYFLAQDVLGASCLFHVSALESAIFTRSPGSF